MKSGDNNLDAHRPPAKLVSLTPVLYRHLFFCEHIHERAKAVAQTLSGTKYVMVPGAYDPVNSAAG